MEKHSWSHVGFIFFSIVSLHKLSMVKVQLYSTNWNFLMFLNLVYDCFRSLLELQGMPQYLWTNQPLVTSIFNYHLQLPRTSFSDQYNYSNLYQPYYNSTVFCYWQVFPIIFCRATNVFSCAYLVNLSRPAHRQIPVKHQKALWYSGKIGRNSLWFFIFYSLIMNYWIE